MRRIEVIAAVDIGTTSAKAVTIDRQGRIVARGKAGYATAVGASGQAEQSPEDWWAAACEALRACAAPGVAVVALALTGQMQDLVLTAEGNLLRPAILYSDQRATAEAADVLGAVPVEEWVHVTGNLQDASGLPAKLLWLRRNEPELYHRAERLLLGAHDYVSWRACGAELTDVTTASTTGLMDLASNTWAVGLLESLGLRTDWLPDLKPTHEPAGYLTDEAAAQLSLPTRTPVFHSAGDAATTAIGIGADEPGMSYLYLGTSGWLATTTPGHRANPQSGIFTLRHPVPEWTILIGPMLTSGGSLDWMRRTISRDATYQAVEEVAAAAPPGSGGLIFLPYLAGERAPFRDPDARGALIGLSTATSRGEIFRSVMEGVAFAFRSIEDAMTSANHASGRFPLVFAGGGSRSELWCQILATVMGRTVRRSDAFEDVAVRGAAGVAGKALGWYGNDSCPWATVDEVTFEPDIRAIPVYEGLYETFRDLYPALSSIYKRLAGLRPSSFC